MSVCFKIPSATRDGIASAFASNDVLMKLIAKRWHEEDEEGKGVVAAILPHDDYYMAPYALVTQRTLKRKDRDAPEISHYIVFSGYKTREYHGDACCVMKMGECFDSMQEILEGALGNGVAPSSVVKFRRHPCAGGKDVCTKLEDYAFATACSKLGVNSTLEGWRAMRQYALNQLIKRIDRKLASVPLAVLPEHGEVDFTPPTPEEEAAADKQRRADERAAREAAVKRENNFQAAKKARYARMFSKIKEEATAVPNGAGCVAVFDTDPDGNEVEFCCPYDRVGESTFCSACKSMIEKIA